MRRLELVPMSVPPKVSTSMVTRSLSVVVLSTARRAPTRIDGLRRFERGHGGTWSTKTTG
jgi:hypothetical protein